jgi:signal transduction histidine kinase
LSDATFEQTNIGEVSGDIGVGAGVAVPISVEGKTWGVLTTGTSGASPPRIAKEKLEKFAALAAAAIANAENRAQLTASRARIVATADETRRRLQRDVHDGAQQRLVQAVLTLKLARDAASTGEPTGGLIDEALRYAERATSELRDLVHGILPASLSRGGLRSGIESLVADIQTPVDLDFSAPRLPAQTEITAYFVVAEALTNVVKHARATRAFVRIGVRADWVHVEVTDDGVGGADVSRGSGLTGLLDRVETAEGTLVVTSPVGSGTTVHASLPVRWL